MSAMLDLGVFGVVLLVLAAVLYLGSLAVFHDINRSDAAGNGLTLVAAQAVTLLLWLILAALAGLALWRGALPRPAAWGLLLLTPALAAAALRAIHLASNRLAWPLVVPILAPLLVATALRVPWTLAPAALLAVLPWLLSTPSPRAEPSVAVEEPDHTPRTQAALEDALRHGLTNYVRDLPDLNLELTPAVCEGVRRALRDLVKDMRPNPNNRVAPYFTQAATVLEYQRGLDWAIRRGCACSPELLELESVVRQYQDTPERQRFLQTLADWKSRRP